VTPNAARRSPLPWSAEHRSRLFLWTRRVFPHRRKNWNPGQGIALVAVQKHGAGMSGEKAAVYRLHAAHCTELAQRISDPKGRLSLLEMSRMWLRLAEMSEAEQSAVAIAETDPLKLPVR
jgi:hypothetical protein